MHYVNPRATRQPYPADLLQVMSIAKGRESRAWLSTWSQLAPQPTPVWSLPRLAQALGVGSVHLKDESSRSPLGSFKVLGAPIALVRLVLRRWPDAGWTAQALLAGQHAARLQDFVVITATDGNHGRALAAAAQSLGCRCVIVLHAHVSKEREDAIAAFGAQIVRIQGDYDASVTHAARLAQENGWDVVSDTSYDGYEAVPRDVMQGYGILVDELLEAQPQEGACPYTHVFLQGGVGGLPAGVVSHFWERYGAGRPIFIVVEPEQADCLLQSAIAGRAASASGSVDSLMAGLACGQTSPLAWRFLQPAVDVFMTVTDDHAASAMKVLATGSSGDVPILSGESGAAGVAGLQVAAADPALRAALALDAGARVLLVSTEGATAPSVYRQVVGLGADAVLAAQRQWRA